MPGRLPCMVKELAHRQRSRMHRLKVGQWIELQHIDTALTQQALSAKRQNSYQPSVLLQDPW